MPISRDDVIYGYKFLLHREPESEEIIQHHIKNCQTFDDLRAGLYNSREYRDLHRWYRYPGRVYETPLFLSERIAGIAYQEGEPDLLRPVWQLCTQAQIQSPEYERWRQVRRDTARLYRKGWEWNYILRVLECAGKLKLGSAGLGFAVGKEPLPAVMASLGCTILATDAPPDVAQAGGWLPTQQYASALSDLNAEGLCPATEFTERVNFRIADMRKLPPDLGSFDFLWSSCALEHLGSMESGIQFIEQSLRFLRPGGIAVHTTEFNLSSSEMTIETETGCFYRKRDIEALWLRLRDAGYELLPVNFSSGSGPADQHVDIEPFFT